MRDTTDGPFFVVSGTCLKRADAPGGRVSG